MDNTGCIAKWLWVSAATNLVRSRQWLPIVFFALLLPRQVVAHDAESYDADLDSISDSSFIDDAAYDEPYDAESYNADLDSIIRSDSIGLLEKLHKIDDLLQRSHNHYLHKTKGLTDYGEYELEEPLEVVHFVARRPTKEPILCSIKRSQYLDSLRVMVTDEGATKVTFDDDNSSFSIIKESLLSILSVMSNKLLPTSSITHLIHFGDGHSDYTAEKTAEELQELNRSLRDNICKEYKTKLELDDNEIKLIVSGLRHLGLSKSPPNYNEWLSLYAYTHSDSELYLPEINEEWAAQNCNGDTAHKPLYKEFALLSHLTAAVTSKFGEQDSGSYTRLSIPEKQVSTIFLSLSNLLLSTQASQDDLKTIQSRTQEVFKYWIEIGGMKGEKDFPVFVSEISGELRERLEESFDTIMNHPLGTENLRNTIENIANALDVLKDIFKRYLRAPIGEDFFNRFSYSYRTLAKCGRLHFGLSNRQRFPATYHSNLAYLSTGCEGCDILGSNELPDTIDWQDDFYNFLDGSRLNSEVFAARDVLDAEVLMLRKKRVEIDSEKAARSSESEDATYLGRNNDSITDGTRQSGRGAALLVALSAAALACIAFVILGMVKSRSASTGGDAIQKGFKQ